MDPIDIYELFFDAEKNEIRVSKLQSLKRKAYVDNDLNSLKKLERHLSECLDLQKRLDEFFSNYIKQN